MTNEITEKKGLQQFARLTGWIVSRAALTIAYFGIFMPAGFIMRLLDKDPLYRRLDSAASTYYRPSKERATDHMDKPY